MVDEVDRLLVRIDAATETLRRELDKGNQAVAHFETTTNKRLKKVDDTFKRFGRNLASVFGAYLSFQGARHITQSFIETTKEVQTLDARLTFLTGSTEKAAETNKFLTDASDKLGLSLLDLSKNYAAFLPLVNAGLITTEEARQTTLGLADASAALGANSAQLGQVMYGLSQVLASGVVKTQDFRQVISPLPGLLQAMEKAAGLGANGLFDLIGAGKATSQYIKEILIKALQDFSGAAAANSDKVQGEFNKLNNAWVKFVRSLQPAAGILTATLEGMTSAISSAADAIERISAKPMYDFGQALEENKRRAAELRMELDKIAARQKEALSKGIVGRGEAAAIGRQGVPLTAELNALNARNPEYAIQGLQRRLSAIRSSTRGISRGSQAATIADIEQQIQALQSNIAVGGLAPITVSAQRRQLLGVTPGNITPRQKPFDAAAGFMQDRTKAVLQEVDQIMSKADEALGNVEEKVKANREAMESWLRSVSDGFADAILGAQNFGDALKGILLQLAKAELSNAIFGLINPGGTSGGSIIGGIVNKIAGRASGGPVAAGVPYIVGEKQPELFIPKTSGYIMPNTSSGGIVVHQTIAPNFAGNAATQEDLVAMSQLTKQSTIQAIREIQTRPGH